MANEYQYTHAKQCISVNDRVFTAKLRFERKEGKWPQGKIRVIGFRRNMKGEILYALPGTKETATESQICRATNV